MIRAGFAHTVFVPRQNSKSIAPQTAPQSEPISASRRNGVAARARGVKTTERGDVLSPRDRVGLATPRTAAEG
jgi:hypothetical protein